MAPADTVMLPESKPSAVSLENRAKDNQRPHGMTNHPIESVTVKKFLKAASSAP
jgi:hypothetical protein